MQPSQELKKEQEKVERERKRAEEKEKKEADEKGRQEQHEKELAHKEVRTLHRAFSERSLDGLLRYGCSPYVVTDAHTTFPHPDVDKRSRQAFVRGEEEVQREEEVRGEEPIICKGQGKGSKGSQGGRGELLFLAYF